MTDRGGALRVIDANANRAREAARVMEEAARFVVGDGALSRACKEVRHGVRGAVEALPVDALRLIAHRDTPGDVGTGIGTAAEGERAGVRGVVAAAGKRLGEALRSIEEYAKTIEGGGACARLAERARYAGYDAERRLMLALGGGRVGDGGDGWRVCVLVTEALCVLPWEEVVERAVAGGAACVQLREKGLEGGELVERARRCVAICRAGGAACVVNDRADVALAAGADGVHVGQGDMGVEAVRRIAGAGLVVGVSTSCVEEAARAVEAGADYCGVGPMFETATKAKERIAGPGYLSAYLERFGVPCLAIGGVGVGNVGALVEAAASAGVVAGERSGGWGVAVSSAVCGSREPEAVCRELSGRVGSSRGGAAVEGAR